MPRKGVRYADATTQTVEARHGERAAVLVYLAAMNGVIR